MKTQIKKYLLALTLISSSSAHALDVRELMWGVNNTGRPLAIDVNPLQSYRLQAVAGEDINLAPVQKGRKVRVAVLDTGVDTSNSHLSPFIKRNADKCEAYEKLKQCLVVDNDQNSKKCRDAHLKAAENVYPADCTGWSILDQGITNTPNNIIGRPDFSDNSGHGTHVAGIITAVSQNVEIIPVQVVGDGPNQPIKPFSIDLSPSENVRNGYSTDTLSERVSRGIIYAMASGAEVINLSIGWPENQNTDIIKAAIAEAQRRGILIVAAAGNDSTSALLRPCQYKGVICVGAHAPDGSIASFSNFGYGVDIAAPGVEIVSTIPNTKRSVRLPGVRGFDLMSGTSQATPFVSGVVAEMLSRGIPASEIYPRLMLGARKVKKELPVLVGPMNSRPQQVDASTKYTKTVLSGLLDMTQALQVQAQPLIFPANKEVPVINWNRKSAELQFKMSLKNYWSALNNARIQIAVRPTQDSAVEPHVVSVQALENVSSWAQGQEKQFNVNLRIKDATDPSQSRLPSELSYQVAVYVNGQLHRQFEIKAEVLVTVSAAIAGSDVYQYQLNGEIPRGMKLSLVDEVLDNAKSRRDYFMVGKDDSKENHFNIALVRNNGAQYTIERVQSLKFDGDISLTRPQYKVRLDMDGDGKTEYLYGIIEYLDKELTIYGDYRNHFYIFDDQMNLKKYVIFDDKRAALPYTFYWMKVKGQLRPAWIGRGQEIVKKWDITDLWSTDGTAQDAAQAAKSRVDIHAYFLDENFKLDQMKTSNEGERIVDLIQPTGANAANGIITVLIAKNRGTEMKPSYLNDFSVATVQDGRITQQQRINSSGSGIEYRNLIDTFADKTMSLKSESNEYRGMMWYGLDAGQKQRVTMIDLENMQMTDKLISSQRQVHDNALLVKAGFQSETKKGVFLITNSELEFHDLTSDQVTSRSLNRYSFFGDANFVELYFPITLSDRQNAGQKLPALFTTEQSALSRGIRMLTPVYNQQGQLQQMVSPARLRLVSEAGCKPLEAPVFLGDQHGYAMDYQCSNKILRFLLKY